MRREVIVIVRRILDERSGQYEPLLEHGRVEQGLEGAAARAGSGNHVHLGSAKAAGKTVCIAIICLHLSAVHVQNQYSHVVHQVLVVDFEMVAGYVVDPFLQSFVNGAGVGFVTALGAQPFKQVVGLVGHRQRLVGQRLILGQLAFKFVYYAFAA